MPWVVADVDRFNTGLSRRDKRRWVAVANSALKTCQEKNPGSKECEGKAIQIANGVIKNRKERENKMTNRLGEITKKIGARNYPASSFLVVEDPEKTSTWHLPVKRPDGTPDRRLAGAAWAALFNPNGYRGNKYEGAKKGEAQSKLRALYKANDWEEPASEAETVAQETVTEYDSDMAEWYGENGSEIPYVPSGVTSFSQLDALVKTQEVSENIRKLTGLYTQMVTNIVYWYEGDKISQVQSVSDEYIDRLDRVLSGEEYEIPEEPEEPEGADMESQPANVPDLVEVFTEADASQVITLEEAQPTDDVLHLNIRIIRPGWGNKTDNHYYSADMLKKYAERFEGAKMFETDHRPEEKSNKTWVSTITDIVGFTEDGAPIGRVAVHDNDFASRVKNLNTAGLLDKLECSIYASGKAQSGFELDGRKGKNVLEISDVSSVDWVTKAGAGGKALALAEADKTGVEDMTDQKIEEPKTEDVISPAEKDGSEIDVTVISEDQTVTGGSDTETPAAADTDAEVNTPPQLSGDAVRSLLEATKLPKVAIDRLAGAVYADETALTVAIEAEKKYLADLLQSGKVVGLGEVDKAKPKASTAEAVYEAGKRVNQKYFGG